MCVRPESRLREMETQWTNNQMAGGLCQNQTKAVIHHANRIKKRKRKGKHAPKQNVSERRTAGSPSIHTSIMPAGEAEGGLCAH